MSSHTSKMIISSSLNQVGVRYILRRGSGCVVVRRRGLYRQDGPDSQRRHFSYASTQAQASHSPIAPSQTPPFFNPRFSVASSQTYTPSPHSPKSSSQSTGALAPQNTKLTLPSNQSYVNQTNNTNSQEKATFFSSSSGDSFPSQSLPSYFGPAINIARRSNFVFRHGASGIPKPLITKKERDAAADIETMRKANDLDHNLSISVGEDAYFLRTDSLGVADGVGSWSRHVGANPARWSRKLMHYCSVELARYDNVEDEMFLQYYQVDPVIVLQKAFEKSLAECREEGLIGSSTAMLAVLRNDELRLAHLGDCTCFIIRDAKIVFQTTEQQHSFNFPYQAGTNVKDTPINEAKSFTFKVQKDDIVILSSDGLTDNIFELDILEEVLSFMEEIPEPGSLKSTSYSLNRFSPQIVSEALCQRARSVYEDEHAPASPFQVRAVEEGISFVGGKIDDITTLVGVVGELESTPDRRL